LIKEIEFNGRTYAIDKNPEKLLTYAREKKIEDKSIKFKKETGNYYLCLPKTKGEK